VKSKSARGVIVILAMLALVGLGTAIGLSFDTSYRIACAAACIIFIASLALDYPDDLWPKIGLIAATLINAGLFLTPVFHRPSSRGELMLFALPDAIALLSVRLAYFSVSTDHERAQRQMVIFGLVVAVVFCAVLYSVLLLAR